MARLRDLSPGSRVETRSGFLGTVVGTARLHDVNVVLVHLDLLGAEERNPVVVFPENLALVTSGVEGPTAAAGSA